MQGLRRRPRPTGEARLSSQGFQKPKPPSKRQARARDPRNANAHVSARGPRLNVRSLLAVNARRQQTKRGRADPPISELPCSAATSEPQKPQAVRLSSQLCITFAVLLPRRAPSGYAKPAATTKGSDRAAAEPRPQQRSRSLRDRGQEQRRVIGPCSRPRGLARKGKHPKRATLAPSGLAKALRRAMCEIRALADSLRASRSETKPHHGLSGQKSAAAGKGPRRKTEPRRSNSSLDRLQSAQSSWCGVEILEPKRSRRARVETARETLSNERPPKR